MVSLYLYACMDLSKHEHGCTGELCCPIVQHSTVKYNITLNYNENIKYSSFFIFIFLMTIDSVKVDLTPCGLTSLCFNHKVTHWFCIFRNIES